MQLVCKVQLGIQIATGRMQRVCRVHCKGATWESLLGGAQSVAGRSSISGIFLFIRGTEGHEWWKKLSCGVICLAERQSC